MLVFLSLSLDTSSILSTSIHFAFARYYLIFILDKASFTQSLTTKRRYTRCSARIQLVTGRLLTISKGLGLVCLPHK